jgi:ribosomal protein S18 acetylase RimI-like enzyme
MIDYEFLTVPTKTQVRNIIQLYRLASWWSDQRDDEMLVVNIIHGSHCFLAALDGGHVIGMGRAISDRVHDAYIQDVTVHPDWRHQGIGHTILNKLIVRLQEEQIKWIGLIAGNNTSSFYRPLGFAELDNTTPMLLQRKP